MYSLPACPPGFETFNQKCYKFFSEGLPWHEAQTTCQNLEGKYDLVKINNQEELTFLRNRAKELDIYCLFWIGLNDITEEDLFQWPDGSNNTFEYPWGEGEPNNLVSTFV